MTDEQPIVGKRDVGPDVQEWEVTEPEGKLIIRQVNGLGRTLKAERQPNGSYHFDVPAGATVLYAVVGPLHFDLTPQTFAQAGRYTIRPVVETS